MKKLLRLSIILSLFTIASCIPKEENPPAYIKIENVKFVNSNTSITGFGGANIPDVWIYLDNDLSGLFELPVVIPVAFKGRQNIRVGAGIKQNGISSTRAQYDFYETWETSGDSLKPFDTLTLHPEVRYFDGLTFTWKEDFENIAVSFDTLPSGDVPLQRISSGTLPNDIYEDFIGKFQIDADKRGFKAITSTEIEIPSSTGPIYMEMNYNCNQSFLIGVVSRETGGPEIETPFIGLNPTDENGEFVWNKIYIELTPMTQGRPNVEYFKITITANYSSENDTGIVLLDNFKIIYP